MKYGESLKNSETRHENLVRLAQFLQEQPNLIGLLKQTSTQCQDELLTTAGTFGYGVPISENQMGMIMGAAPEGGVDPIEQKGTDTAVAYTHSDAAAGPGRGQLGGWHEAKANKMCNQEYYHTEVGTQFSDTGLRGR